MMHPLEQKYNFLPKQIFLSHSQKECLFCQSVASPISIINYSIMSMRGDPCEQKPYGAAHQRQTHNGTEAVCFVYYFHNCPKGLLLQEQALGTTGC